MSNTKIFILIAFIMGMIGIYESEKKKQTPLISSSIEYDHPTYIKNHNSQCEICKHQ